MPESQHIEWKQTWRDEFLKWICGFANANAEGEVLEIGRAADGTLVGVPNAKVRSISASQVKSRILLGRTMPSEVHSLSASLSAW